MRVALCWFSHSENRRSVTPPGSEDDHKGSWRLGAALWQLGGSTTQFGLVRTWTASLLSFRQRTFQTWPASHHAPPKLSLNTTLRAIDKRVSNAFPTPSRCRHASASASTAIASFSDADFRLVATTLGAQGRRSLRSGASGLGRSGGTCHLRSHQLIPARRCTHRGRLSFRFRVSSFLLAIFGDSGFCTIRATIATFRRRPTPTGRSIFSRPFPRPHRN